MNHRIDAFKRFFQVALAQDAASDDAVEVRDFGWMQVQTRDVMPLLPKMGGDVSTDEAMTASYCNAHRLSVPLNVETRKANNVVVPVGIG